MSEIATAAIAWQLSATGSTDLVAAYACDFSQATDYRFTPKGTLPSIPTTITGATGVVIDNMLNATVLTVQVGAIVEVCPAYQKINIALRGANSPDIVIYGSGGVVPVYFYTGTFLGNVSNINTFAAYRAGTVASLTNGTVDAYLDSVSWNKNVILANGFNLDNLGMAGFFDVLNPTTTNGQGAQLPAGTWSIEAIVYSSSNLYQIQIARNLLNATLPMYSRANVGGAWTGWTPQAVYNPDDTRELAIQVAMLKGSVANMFGGIADAFRDQTGYQASLSTNVVYNATGHTVGNQGVGTADDLAYMTSNSAPAGQTASENTGSGGNTQYEAYDGVSSTFYGTATWTPGSAAIWRTSSNARIEAGYSVASRTDDATRAPTAWQRWGSNDGGNTRTVLDTQSGITWTAGTKQSFKIPVGNQAKYTTYGVTWTAGITNNIQISAIESFPLVSGPMRLVSTSFAVPAVPTKGQIYILMQVLAGALALNQNFVARMSRDNGQTWTQFTLSQTNLIGGFIVLEGNNQDLTQQGSGTTILYDIQALGSNFTVIIGGVVAQAG